MVACWFAVAGALVARGRAGWFPLVVCLAVLLIKRPDWSPALLVLAGGIALAAAVLFWRRRSRGYTAVGAIGLLWLLWSAAVWRSYSDTHCGAAAPFDPDRPIACLGDSLTTGLAEGEAYPDYLQQLVSVPVLNFAQPGIPLKDAIKQLPAVLAKRPQVVVVELGGHDFLRGYGRAATRAQLVRIIEASRGMGATVVLVEIPRGFITDPFAGLERELARQYDLELVPDTAIRLLVLRSPAIPAIGALTKPHWSDDGLHPNEVGARNLAQEISRALATMYGPTCLVQPSD